MPAPNELTDRIEGFARDLAYGVIQDFWSPHIEEGMMRSLQLQFPVVHQDKYDALIAKWPIEVRPSITLLQIFGYLGGNQLTRTAFSLLKRPASPPSVFISYKRDYSSAFGLLIESRLRAIGVDAFIDRSLGIGPWPEQLEEKIKESKYIVCLLAPQTLNSEVIKQELRWAQKYQKKIVPIWHSEFNETRIPDAFNDLGMNHAIVIRSESAEAYHDGVEKLINRLGYSSLSTT